MITLVVLQVLNHLWFTKSSLPLGIGAAFCGRIVTFRCCSLLGWVSGFFTPVSCSLWKIPFGHSFRRGGRVWGRCWVFAKAIGQETNCQAGSLVLDNAFSDQFAFVYYINSGWFPAARMVLMCWFIAGYSIKLYYIRHLCNGIVKSAFIQNPFFLFDVCKKMMTFVCQIIYYNLFEASLDEKLEVR